MVIIRNLFFFFSGSDSEDLEDMVEGGDEVEPDTDTTLISSSVELLSAVTTTMDDTVGSGTSNSSGGLGEAWTRVDRLPMSLKTKLLELKEEK